MSVVLLGIALIDLFMVIIIFAAQWMPESLVIKGALLLILKGFIFTLMGFNFASIIDILIGLYVIIVVFTGFAPMVLSVLCLIYLIVKIGMCAL